MVYRNVLHTCISCTVQAVHTGDLCGVYRNVLHTGISCTVQAVHTGIYMGFTEMRMRGTRRPAPYFQVAEGE